MYIWIPTAVIYVWIPVAVIGYLAFPYAYLAFLANKSRKDMVKRGHTEVYQEGFIQQSTQKKIDSVNTDDTVRASVIARIDAATPTWAPAWMCRWPIPMLLWPIFLPALRVITQITTEQWDRDSTPSHRQDPPTKP